MHFIQQTGMALALSLSFTCGIAQVENNFTINGMFTDTAGMPKTVYLYFNENQCDERVYSADVINGAYRFTGHLDFVTQIDLKDRKKEKQGITLIIDKGDLAIKSAGNLFNEGNRFQYKTTGPGANAQNDYMEILHPVRTFVDSLKMMQNDPAYRDDPNKLQATIVKLYGSDFLTRIFVMTYDRSLDFVRTHPQSSITPYLLTVLLNSPYPKLPSGAFDSLMAGLPATARAETKKIIAHIYMEGQAQAKAKTLKESKTAIGVKAPDFAQNDVNGHPVSLSSLQGKYVLLDFWASWCGPCRKENSHVLDAYNAYKDKGFTVLGVSLDNASTKAAWVSAIKKDGLTWPELSDLEGWQNKVARLYNVKALPQNFLINPDGTIIATNLSGEALQKELASILK